METDVRIIYSKGCTSNLQDEDLLRRYPNELLEEGFSNYQSTLHDEDLQNKSSKFQENMVRNRLPNKLKDEDKNCKYQSKLQYEEVNRIHSSELTDKEMLSGPQPTPSRAKYGFSLYLGSTGCFFAYLIWGLVPKLETGGLELALPSRYWAVALPIWSLVTLATVALLFYPAVNAIMAPEPSSPLILADSFSKPMPEGEPKKIPHIYDMDPAVVSKLLYLQPEH